MILSFQSFKSLRGQPGIELLRDVARRKLGDDRLSRSVASAVLRYPGVFWQERELIVLIDPKERADIGRFAEGGRDEDGRPDNGRS